MIKDSTTRVQKYLDRLATSKGYDKECIHTFLTGDGEEIPLLASDLKELVQFVLDSHRAPLSDELPKGFLSDVLTAAGLVSHGKQCKALGSRIGEAVESIWEISIQQREALPTHGITQEKQV